MRKLNAAVDRFAYSHPRFGIPNLMKFLVGVMAVVFVLDLFSNGYATYMLYFNAQLILRGELWRLVTWMFLPTSGSCCGSSSACPSTTSSAPPWRSTGAPPNSPCSIWPPPC